MNPADPPTANPRPPRRRFPQHPRLSRPGKWLALAAFLALTIAWLGSTRFYIWWITTRGVAFNVSGGRLSIADTRAVALVPHGWTFRRSPDRAPLAWWPTWDDGAITGSIPHINIPLWTFALPTLISAVLLFRRDARLRRLERLPHLCTGCNYDLRGLRRSEPCPECGRRAATNASFP